MEKLKRNVILSLAIAAVALVVLAKGVFATSGTVAMQTIPTANSAANNTAANTAGNAVSLNGNVAKDNQVANQLVPQNNTPANATTVPQTGEYDTYIIAGIAVVVVAIGAFSFINSRRYN